MIKIQIDDNGILIALRQAQARVGNMRPLMAGMATLMLEAVEENFDKETDPETGARWKALAESTLRQRRESGRGGKILQVSGQLAGSIQPDYGNTFALVGTNKVYAAAHQLGSSPYTIKPRTKKALAFGGVVVKSVNHPGLPARKFLGLTKQHAQAIKDSVEKYITQGLV